MADPVFIRTEAFEGPFDLLYHLIEKNEVDIYDIPIFTITEQYLEYMETMNLAEVEDGGMETTSGFVLMAATLLEIKSRLLLPKKPIEGEEPEEDPRAALVRRLEEYGRYKGILPALRDMEEAASLNLYKTRDATLPIGELAKPVFDIDEALLGVTADRLLSLFKEVLSRRDLRVDRIRADFGAIAKDAYTIAQKTAHIAALLRMYGSLRFFDAFDDGASRLEIIVTFLALLELIKTRRATIEQEGRFGEIFINATHSIIGEGENNTFGNDALEADGD